MDNTNKNSPSDANLTSLLPVSTTPSSRPASSKSTNVLHQLELVNKELWLILSMIAILAAMNYLTASHRIVLSLYVFPTIFSAYYYGRRHATLTAVASILIVGLIVYKEPRLFSESLETGYGPWYDIFSWGAILMVTAYAMGTLHERNRGQIAELKQAYLGLIIILRQFISNDKYTENHCYRVSIYAAKIASYMRMRPGQIEDIRAAALLHDLGKLDISREILYKAAKLTSDEYEGMKKHVDKGVEMLVVANTPLNRIIPIILAHHERHDGSGYFGAIGDEIPIEAKVIAVADVYDALASDRPYRKALTPSEAKEQIAKGRGSEFDPLVVEAFLRAFHKGDMEIPNIVL